ncbi:MAG TPA: hypothetical protein VML54_04405, partial [Candidatus Limnocylindrales bacterium]|nr:hypothetical protein [Candidatus Limnocylindrales bacterium]
MIVLGLLAASGSPGLASTWTVNLQGPVGDAPFQVGFQVSLPDPSGSAEVSLGGLPVVASHTVDTFTV